ncbi:MAG: hypothetical protein AB7P40_31860 [Chloroflexota bacterium]
MEGGVDGQELPELPPVEPVVGDALAAWKTGGRAYVVVRIAGDGPRGEDAEYLASVSEEELARLSPSEQRRALLAAVKVERDRQRSLHGVNVRDLVGPVEL